MVLHAAFGCRLGARVAEIWRERHTCHPNEIILQGCWGKRGLHRKRWDPVSVCVCAFWRRGVAAVFMCKTCSETSGRDRENTTEKLFADYIAEAYRHASPHTSPCLKIQILNQLPHMNKQHEIQQQTSSPVIQKQKENLLFSTVKVALD